jgi:hypothetical protein
MTAPTSRQNAAVDTKWIADQNERQTKLIESAVTGDGPQIKYYIWGGCLTAGGRADLHVGRSSIARHQVD